MKSRLRKKMLSYSKKQLALRESAFNPFSFYKLNKLAKFNNFILNHKLHIKWFKTYVLPLIR